MKNTTIDMKKKKYESMSVSPLALDYETALLVESPATPKVSIQENVTVEDYTIGFSNGSSEVGFEVGFGE